MGRLADCVPPAALTEEEGDSPALVPGGSARSAQREPRLQLVRHHPNRVNAFHLFVVIDEIARLLFSPEPLLISFHFQYRILGSSQLQHEGICELFSNTRVFRILCLVDTFFKILIQIKEPRVV